MDDTTLDGNAAGGILREIFPFEMTLVEETCAHCSGTSPVGALTVYKSSIRAATGSICRGYVFFTSERSRDTSRYKTIQALSQAASEAA